MWFPLRVGDFIAKKIENDDYYIIFLSNFKKIWYKSIKDQELLSVAKEFNPLFEASDRKLKEITLGLINEHDNITKNVAKEGNDLILTLESNILDVKFQFQIKLIQGNEEMLYNEFILPLLLMTVKMKNLEENLTNVIESKHLESENYMQDVTAENYSRKSCSTTNSLNERKLINKSFNSVISEIISNPSFFLDYIDKKLFCNETVLKNDEDKISLNSNLEEKDVDAYDNNKLVSSNKIYKLKNINQCVKLDNEMIKKRKKQTNSCKIKI